MTSHELARRLLALPDMPVATYANGHTYSSLADAPTHGPLTIGRLIHYSGVDHLVLGNFAGQPDINRPNWYVVEFYGTVSESTT